MIENNLPKNQVVIGGVNRGDDKFDYYMQELKQLASANNMEVVGEVSQNLEKLIAATYFGSGKVSEIKVLAEEQNATHLVVNDELTPTQIRNLEKETKLVVTDRTELILEIFSNRAKTKQAKLQVALARLQYEMPRLHQTENSLDQQRGAGKSGLANRGAGETKLELNRRTLGNQITLIKEELKNIDKSESTRRKERNKSQLPQVALVGYTNAGKSTTMNGLIDLFSQVEDPQKKAEKQVFEKDMLFATLDTSVRRIDLKNNFSFLLSDTVGFISKLPHKLIESFKATLQEAKDADLLIHVVDFSDPNYQDMIDTTNEVLKEIGIYETPTLMAFNKADQTSFGYPGLNGEDFYYSARDPKSIEMLSGLITDRIFSEYREVNLKLPLDQGKLLSYLHEKAEIISQDYQTEGIFMTVKLNPEDLIKVEKFIV